MWNRKIKQINVTNSFAPTTTLSVLFRCQGHIGADTNSSLHLPYPNPCPTKWPIVIPIIPSQQGSGATRMIEGGALRLGIAALLLVYIASRVVVYFLRSIAIKRRQSYLYTQAQRKSATRDLTPVSALPNHTLILAACSYTEWFAIPI